MGLHIIDSDELQVLRQALAASSVQRISGQNRAALRELLEDPVVDLMDEPKRANYRWLVSRAERFLRETRQALSRYHVHALERRRRIGL